MNVPVLRPPHQRRFDVSFVRDPNSARAHVMTSDPFLQPPRELTTASTAPAAVLRSLSPPERLWVPCTPRAVFEAIEPKPPGTRVARGEPLTIATPQTAHAALAPAGGRVVSLGRTTLLDGREVPAVLIELDRETPDGPRPPPPSAPPPPAPSIRNALDGERQADLGSWIDRLRHAGVWADRWTSPDLIGQLQQALRRPVDTIVCNVLDVDLSVPLQAVVAAAAGVELAAGVALLAQLTRANRAWAVIDSLATPDFYDPLQKSVESAGVRLVPLRNDYPQANPTLLLHRLTKRKLHPGGLPTEQGVILLDAAAAVAIGRCLLGGRAMLDTPLAVFDGLRGQAHFVTALVGTPLREVLAQLGIAQAARLLRGGSPLRDLRVTPDAVAGGAELTIYATAPEPDVNPDPCIRCGWCVEGCPVRIQPAGLLEAAQRNDLALADKYGLEACIECGICSYVCPSYLPLLPGIRSLRAGEQKRQIED